MIKKGILGRGDKGDVWRRSELEKERGEGWSVCVCLYLEVNFFLLICEVSAML